MAMGRPQRPHVCSWIDETTGKPEVIVGLYRCPDGRWLFKNGSEAGKKITEPDERRAVTRFKNQLPRPATVAVPISTEITKDDRSSSINLVMRSSVPAADFWPWLREQLLDRPEWIGEMTGIPELASLRRFAIPKDAVPISAVIESYKSNGQATGKSKREALAAFNLLVEHTAAKTLADFTDEKLASFRAHIVEQAGLTSSGTINAYFSRCRNVVKIAARGELDALQLQQTLDKMKAKLFAPPNNVQDDPHPISREDFHLLLDNVDKTEVPHVWRAMLLLGLNAALYLEDLCDLRWDMLDLEKGTFVARRKKRGRCLRAATLWPDTIKALKALPKTGSPFVLVSNRGTRYNKNTKVNDFKDFRNKVSKELAEVTFSHLRDGAYTAAAHAPGVEGKFAELLAGHSSGMKDKYVIRSPEIVKPACDAVYAAYFG